MLWQKSVRLRAGGQWLCRVTVRERSRKWREANPERQKAAEQKWRDANKARTAKRGQRWQAANPETTRAKARRHYAKHREAMVAKHRREREKTPEKARERNRRYRETHRTERLLAEHVRRAQKRGTNCAGYTTVERVTARVVYYGSRCAYCGAAYESLDHRIALARGGPHLPANLVPACRKCNSAKGAKSLEEFTH